MKVGEDYNLSNIASRVETAHSFTVAYLEIIDDDVIDELYTKSFQLLMRVSYTDIEGQNITASTTLEVSIRDNEGLWIHLC